ncbi:MAG TPA: oligosaccharide flippase family protein [Pirellulales bacterium]|nr:oligosaccharide flippase family protein [Pirellulales bacterium]
MKPTGKSTGEKVRSALLWNGGFSILRDVVQFGAMLILVRLLTKTDYGAYSMVMSAFAFLNAFSFENFMAHVIQVRDDREVHWQDHFTAALANQFAIFLATNALAFGMSYTQDYASVAMPTHVVSFVAVLAGLGGVRVKMLERAHNWPRLRALHLAGIVGSTLLTITLALTGAGVYALLLGPFLKYVPFVIDLFLIERWRPTFEWQAARFAPAFWFGLNRVTAQAIQRARKPLESGVMTHVVGLAALGVFGRAVGLAQLACQQLAFTAIQAIYPVLTRIAPGSSEYVRASHLVLRGAAWFLIPVGTAAGVLADPLVRFLYGDRWLEVIPLLPWAMGVGVVAGLAQVTYNLTLGNLQHRVCLVYDLWQLLGTALGLGVLFYTGSPAAYLAAQATAEGLGLAGLFWQLRQANAIQGSGIAAAILHALVAAGLSLAIGIATLRLLGLERNSWGGAFVFGITFAAAYVGVLRLLFAEPLGELLGQLPAGRRLGRWLRLAPQPAR